MGLNVITIFVLVAAIAAYYLYSSLYAPLPAPKIELDKYWGPSSQANQPKSNEIKPFKIEYTADVIAKLQKRLSEPIDFVEPLENVGFRYGFHKTKLIEMIKFWRDDYLPRWNERQQYLNSLPQYVTEVQG